MLALTLWPEWAWAIAHLDKRVENRDWPADRALWGQRIAIHAGKHIGGRPAKVAIEQGMMALEDVAGAFGWDIDPVLRGHLVEEWGDEWDTPWARNGERIVHQPIATSAIVATARLVGCYRGLRDPWANEEGEDWGWKLDDVATLAEPVTGVRGYQKLWTLSAADEAQVLERAGR